VLLRVWDVLVFWPYSVFGQNHLCVNDACKQGFHFSEWSKMNYKVTCQPSGRCVIPSGRPSVYCSIRPDDVLLPPGHVLRIEKLLCKLAPSGRFNSTSERLSVLEQFTDSFQVSRKGRSINRPDDVVSRPDAYLLKARIVVQNEPSRHLTDVVRTLVHCIW
jgi:hypothetical protein